jgi:hypothetical protein
LVRRRTRSRRAPQRRPEHDSTPVRPTKYR